MEPDIIYYFLSIVLWSDPNVPTLMMFGPIEKGLIYFLLIAFPVTIAFAELPTYFGYVMSAIAKHNKGFDSDFGKNSSGLTMMSTGSNTTFIRLSGNVFMDTGEMKVECIDPNGYIISNRIFFAPGNYSLNETFKATTGVWKLRYTSLEGSGHIDLHADF